jgi:hypothetical protein
MHSSGLSNYAGPCDEHEDLVQSTKHHHHVKSSDPDVNPRSILTSKQRSTSQSQLFEIWCRPTINLNIKARRCSFTNSTRMWETKETDAHLRMRIDRSLAAAPMIFIPPSQFCTRCHAELKHRIAKIFRHTYYIYQTTWSHRCLIGRSLGFGCSMLAGRS